MFIILSQKILILVNICVAELTASMEESNKITFFFNIVEIKFPYSFNSNYMSPIFNKLIF